FEVEGTQPNTGSTTGSTTGGSTTGSTTGGSTTGSTTGGTSGAPTLYSENFEGQTINLGEQGAVWKVTSPGASGPAAATSDSWFAGTNGYNANTQGYLITPEIDLTNVSSAELSFNQF